MVSKCPPFPPYGFKDRRSSREIAVILMHITIQIEMCFLLWRLHQRHKFVKHRHLRFIKSTWIKLIRRLGHWNLNDIYYLWTVFQAWTIKFTTKLSDFDVFVSKKKHWKITLRSNGAWQTVSFHHVITPCWVHSDGKWAKIAVLSVRLFGLKFVFF
jgi:hypothetical protein